MSYPTVVSFIVNRLLLGLTYFVAIHGNYDSILIELGLSLGGGFLALVNLLQLRFLHYSIGLLNFMVTWAQAAVNYVELLLLLLLNEKIMVACCQRLRGHRTVSKVRASVLRTRNS